MYTREILFIIEDGDVISDRAVTNLSISYVNDLPRVLLDGERFNIIVNYTENQGNITLTPLLILEDSDNMQLLSINVTLYERNLSGQLIQINSSIEFLSHDLIGQTYNNISIDMEYTNTILLSGPGFLEDFQYLLRQIVYTFNGEIELLVNQRKVYIRILYFDYSH